MQWPLWRHIIEYVSTESRDTWVIYHCHFNNVGFLPKNGRKTSRTQCLLLVTQYIATLNATFSYPVAMVCCSEFKTRQWYDYTSGVLGVASQYTRTMSGELMNLNIRDDSTRRNTARFVRLLLIVSLFVLLAGVLLGRWPLSKDKV